MDGQGEGNGRLDETVKWVDVSGRGLNRSDGVTFESPRHYMHYKATGLNSLCINRGTSLAPLSK